MYGLFISIVFLGCGVLLTCGKDDPLSRLETATVVAVLDGDTIRLHDGRVVRYIGIDTPETGELGADSATAFNRTLVLGKKVRLEFGRDRVDRYGRLLAFVFIDRRMVNIELLKAGWAWCYFFEGNLKYGNQMVRAIRRAMKSRSGLWATPRPGADGRFVSSYKGFRFHRPDCTAAAGIKIQNRRTFTARDSAFYAGLAPCRNCRP